jgi:RimJ/RimL family protein N-acetyltransferase
LLEGKNVNLRIAEKEDLPLIAEWISKPESLGEYNPLMQVSKTEVEKMLEIPNEPKTFFIEKKDGTKIGFVQHFYTLQGLSKQLEIGYGLQPNERGRGYCTEAVNLMLDYLFLSTENVRIQALTDTRNVASQRVLEKTGFKKEGTLRKNFFAWGEWRDDFIYSILREEWKAPRILKSKT